MKRVLIGDNAYLFLQQLKKVDYNPEKLDDNSISGGIIDESIHNEVIYAAFSCCGNETFVEDFDDIVEAAKYASGIMAKTIDGYEI